MGARQHATDPPDDYETPTPPPGAPAAAPPTQVTADLPERFGRYRLLKQLGKGGMGTVYLAEDSQLDRRVALKVPRLTPDDGPEVLQRFYREARAAATLDHPNICPVYDFGEIDGTPYLTMAYLQGESLAAVLKSGRPRTQRWVAELARKLALALEEAHRQGVIHRDLKSSNVMLNQRGEPVVMDFGLARRINKEDARLTESGAVMGTPAYMPPEQVLGEVHTMGPACDIYSLGVIIYELLTGKAPFPGPMTAVLAAILTQDPAPPSTHRPDLDPRLEVICLKAMAKKIADRHASMGALAAELADYLSGASRPPGPQPDAHEFAADQSLRVQPVAPVQGEDSRTPHVNPAADQTRKVGGWIGGQRGAAGRKRRGWRPLMLALVPVALVAVGIFFFKPTGGRQNSHPKPDESESPKETVVISNDPPVAPADVVGEFRRFEGHTLPVTGVAFSPDGRWALSASYDKTIRLWDVDSGQELKRFTGHQQVVTGAVFSSDGTRVLSGSWDKTVRVWDVRTGKELYPFQGTSQVIRSVAISRDGRHALSGIEDRTVRLWDVDSGKELRTFVGHTDDVLSVAFSPDGRRALSSSEDRTVRLWDVEKGTELGRLGTNAQVVRGVVFHPDGHRALTGGKDKSVRLWNVDSGQELRHFEGHTEAVWCVAFASDGLRALSGGLDKTVRLWDVESGKELHHFEGHTDTVRGVAFSPDGRRALSSSSDGTVRLWGLPR